MDSLLVPIKQDTTCEEESIKKKAVGHVFEVLKHSTSTIVLDNGLCSPDESKGQSGPNGYENTYKLLDEAALDTNR
jgi:hypothetical protein